MTLVVQHGYSGETRESAGWTIDVIERRFGMPVLRRVDMGTISDGRRDKASSGTFVARRGAVLVNNSNPGEASGLMTMCTCENVVRRKGFFSCGLQTPPLRFSRFQIPFPDLFFVGSAHHARKSLKCISER
jgi:hypothetical protein